MEKIYNNHAIYLDDVDITIFGYGKISFTVKKKHIPKDSMLFIRLMIPMGKIERNGTKEQMPENSIFIPFSDGVLFLIKMFFFEKNGDFWYVKKNPEWPDPYVLANVSSFLPITKKDLDTLQYQIFLLNQDFPKYKEISKHTSLNVSGSQWKSEIIEKEIEQTFISPSFQKALSSKTNLTLLPCIYNKMYPTAIFIYALSQYLLLPFNFNINEKIISFTNDIKIVKKLIHKKVRLRKEDENISNFIKALKKKLDIWEKLDTEFFSQKSNTMIIGLEYDQPISLLLSILEKMVYYFKLAVIISKKKKISLYKKIKTKIQKRVLAVIDRIDTIDKIYVIDILTFYNKYCNSPKQKIVPNHLIKYYDYKKCACNPVVNNDYHLEDLITMLQNKYNGCNCTYNWDDDYMLIDRELDEY